MPVLLTPLPRSSSFGPSHHRRRRRHYRILNITGPFRTRQIGRSVLEFLSFKSSAAPSMEFLFLLLLFMPNHHPSVGGRGR